ncbi:MAG: hypothetical protein ACFFB3_00815 [Candidatus Hodarchaeota archaeon]
MKPIRVSILAAFFSVLLIFLTFNSASEGQSTIITIQTEDENKISLLKPVISVQRHGKWIDFERLNEEEDIPTLRNGNQFRFQATILNRNKTAIKLQTFSVQIYDYSGAISQAFVYEYPEINPIATTTLSPNASMTGVIEGKLDVKAVEPEVGEGEDITDEELSEKFREEGNIFIIQLRFQYTLGQVGDIAVNSENTTFQIPLEEKAPPEVIIWIWGGITLFLVFVLLVGTYGKLQLKKLEKEETS